MQMLYFRYSFAVINYSLFSILGGVIIFVLSVAVANATAIVVHAAKDSVIDVAWVLCYFLFSFGFCCKFDAGFLDLGALDLGIC